MTADLNTVLDAALKLPPGDRAELKRLLDKADAPRRERKGDITKFFGTFDSGDPDSGNNEKIDVDLAREYADDHRPQN